MLQNRRLHSAAKVNDDPDKTGRLEITYMMARLNEFAMVTTGFDGLSDLTVKPNLDSVTG